MQKIVAHTFFIHGYEVQVDNIKYQLTDWLNEQTYTRIFVLVDENTKLHCLPLVALPMEAQIIEISSGEENKNLSTCASIWEQLELGLADRQSLLINLGGGVISDMGGFCAASFKRGIDWINIPTTLLAQVDATVGGKIGIDFNGNKNMLGLFQNPTAIFIDTMFLKTLPAREVVSGKFEMLKHGLIANKEHFEKVLLSELPNTELVLASLHIKKEIVEKDPFENGLRKVLNLGHTFGHAFESLLLPKRDAKLLHGEAVGWGLIAGLFLSNKKLGMDAALVNELQHKLRALLPPLQITSEDFNTLLQFILNDKKNSDGIIKLSLLEGIEKPVFDIELTQEEIIETLTLCRTI